MRSLVGTLLWAMGVSFAVATSAHGQTATSCDVGASDPVIQAATAKNAVTLSHGPWVFSQGYSGKGEGPGWEMYAPLIQRTIGTTCPADTAGFALTMRTWLNSRGKQGTGVIDRRVGQVLRDAWNARRAHVARTSPGHCLEAVTTDVTPVPVSARFEHTTARSLEPRTLKAYQEMAAVARAELPELASDPRLLTVVSAFRTKAQDVAACEKNPKVCDGVAKAKDCSAHWSGRAIDLNVGFLPGSDPLDSTYANRLSQSQGAVYRWLLDNAARFGFVNYNYEPWHWEWQESVAPYGGAS